MIAVLSQLVRVSRSCFSIGPCFVKAVLPLFRFLWKLLPDWFMFWESRSSIGLCYSSKFMASWILPVVQDFVPIQDFFLLEQVHKPCCPMAHVHQPRSPIGPFSSSKLSCWSMFRIPGLLLVYFWAGSCFTPCPAWSWPLGSTFQNSSKWISSSGEYS